MQPSERSGRNHWPEHLSRDGILQTEDKVRRKTTRHILNKVDWQNPVDSNGDLERALYDGLGKILRLPGESDHFYHAQIVFGDVSFHVARIRDFEDYVREVDDARSLEMTPPNPSPERLQMYQERMKATMDRAFTSIIDNPEEFPDPRRRGIISEYLRLRAAEADFAELVGRK